MVKKNSALYATSTIGAAGIIGMLLMMVFANGFSFSLGGYDLSGQAIAAGSEKTPYDAGLEAGYTQCLKDGGKYTEKQAVKKMDNTAMSRAVTQLTGLAVGDTPTCTDTDMDVQGGTTVPVKGSVTAEGRTAYDLCKDRSTITEYYCTTDGKAASYSLTCPTGTECKDAICVAIDTTQQTGQTTGQQTGTNQTQTGSGTASGAGQTGTASGQQTGQTGQQSGTTQQGTASGTQQSGQQTNQNTQISEEEKKKAEEEYKKGYEAGYKKCLDEKKAVTTQNTQTGSGTASGAGQTSGQQTGQTGTASGQQTGQTGQQTGTSQQGTASGADQSVAGYTCQDTDGDYGGKTFTTTVYGEVSGNWYTDKVVKTYKDNCKSADYIYEAYCRADNTAYYTTIKCPTGTTCSEGVCVSTA